MIKCVICVLCAVSLLIINTCILILKPNFGFAENDNHNYSVYYQKWIRTIFFMISVIMMITAIYFALNIRIFLSIVSIFIECLSVIIYSLCKYKCITVECEKIKIERLFFKEINATFDEISLVNYIPNAKVVVKLKKKRIFDVSFNSENFYKFYMSLLEHNVKFKTGKIPNDQKLVILEKFNMTIEFPDKMYREYYKLKNYFHNSKYLFSARNLESKEHIEGYLKESGKTEEEFIKLVKNDLELNGFSPIDIDPITIDGFDFTVIKCLNNNSKEEQRLAYIYKQENYYLVLYIDTPINKEKEFTDKLFNCIKRTDSLDSKSRIVRV